MDPGNGGGPGGHHPARATTNTIYTATKQVDQPQNSRTGGMPVVFATLLLAMPGAVFDRLLVKRCCWCQYAHVHHVPAGARPEQVIRSPRCRPNRSYAIEITAVVPPVVVPAQPRRGAA